MASRIDTVTARNKLRPQRESYWHRLSKGFYVGFRKMSADTSGIWRVCYRDKDGKQVECGLGTLDEHQPGERFDRAVALAREWLANESVGTQRAPQHQSTVEERMQRLCSVHQGKEGRQAGGRPRIPIYQVDSSGSDLQDRAIKTNAGTSKRISPTNGRGTGKGQ